jgi:membrane associated rhomboid family serine protease
MNAGPSGFHNAPVTKCIVAACGLATVLVGTASGANGFSLSYQKVVQKLQLWRLFTSSCVFSSTPELLFGLYLVYFFRVFERQIGSNKYLFFVIFSSVVSTLLEVVALTLLRDPTALTGISLAPGPYGLIFASFVPFFFDIPISTRFKIFGARFSDKSFVYLAGLQLLLSSWKRSLIPGVCGLLAGFIYKSNMLGIRKVKFPEGLASAAGRLFAPLMSGVSTPPTTARGSALNGPGGRPFEHRFAASAPPLSAPAPPPEEYVATLVQMGFDRDDALQALAIARNDITTATTLLLESQLH